MIFVGIKKQLAENWLVTFIANIVNSTVLTLLPLIYIVRRDRNAESAFRALQQLTLSLRI